MDTPTRMICKSITWQIAGFFSMMLIGFLFTGSLSASGGIAIAGSLAGFSSYFVHEIIWSRIPWGQRAANS